MTDAPTETNALAVWASRNEVRELDARLREMLPGADRLTTGQRLALAQASLAHGLDPFNGEIWMIPGRGLMIGVKGLRKKAHEQVKGNYWAEFVELTDPEARKRLRIPDGALAFECRLFDSENLRTYSETVKSLMDAHIPWDAVCQMVGSKPYTLGIGVLKAGEQTKMDPAQCAMKRAEADAIKRRFDVPFGLTVEADAEPDAPGAWIETTPAIDNAPQQGPSTNDDRADVEEHAANQDAAIGAEAIAEQEQASPKYATLKRLTNVQDWQRGCQQIAAKWPQYQTTLKGGTPSGQPNFHHILGAAAKCGYSEVNDGNFELVLEAIGKRAAAIS